MLPPAERGLSRAGTSGLSIVGRMGTTKSVANAGSRLKTIGIVAVAAFAASATLLPPLVAITETRRPHASSGEPTVRNPTTGIAACCACAAIGHAALAPPSAASNSRLPMVTVIRPSRARCVKGRIPRHERAVLTAWPPAWAGRHAGHRLNGSPRGPRSGLLSRVVRFAPESRRGLECSLLSTRENDFGRSSLSLGQERCPVLLFKNEGAARAYGKRIEDTFVSLARNRAGLVTFFIDETNDRPTWGP